MTVTPVTVEDFRGLRLLPEQGEAQGATAMLNVDMPRGASQIGTRGGLSRLGTGTGNYHRIGPYNSGKVVVYRNTGTAAAVREVPVSSGTFGTETTWGAANTYVTSQLMGTGGTAHIIASRSGASNAAAQQYSSGPVVDVSATYGSPRYFAVTADGRAAVAHFTSAAATPSGANGSTCTIFFSNPGAFATYGASNWIALDLSDNDEITGMVAWRELLFVIKRSALYVFSSTSLDATANPVFNYRKVTLPARARATTNGGGENIIAGGDGVYLLLSDGVYRTTGDTPQMVSRDISPLFDGTGDSSMLFPSSGDWTIGYATNRVFLSYTVGVTYRTLVYDTLLGEWLLWDVSAGASAAPTNVLEWVDTNGLPTAYMAAGAKLFSLTKTATSDDGTAIVSSYQSGFDGVGYPSQEKRITGVELVGSGTPTLTVLTDYATSDPLSRQATVTLGTAPAVAGAVHAKAYRGRLFSYKITATSGLWTLGRLTYKVQAVRQAGLRSP